MRKTVFTTYIILIVFSCIQTSAQNLINWSTSWSYFKGTSNPVQSDFIWYEGGYDASTWAKGNAPFRYGDGSGGTLLSDMAGNYSTLFMRKEFTVTDADSVDELEISIDYDDGFVIWLNGTEVLQVNAPLNLAYNQFAPQNHESGDPALFRLTGNEFTLINGTNLISVQGFNVSNTSSDFYLDLQVKGIRLLPENEPVIIDSPSGFYSEVFSTQINTVNPGETIRYTLDGSDPRYSSSAITSTSPTDVIINPVSTVGGRGRTGGVILRSSKFKEGFSPGKPVTRSYIFINSVIAQSHPGGTWPSSNINGQHIDLVMDRNITTDSRYKNNMDEALLDIPSVSISTDMNNLFDPQTGIYVNANYHGSNWERPANIELINPDGSPGFNIDAGIRIRGGWSRHDNFAKHAFRVFFRSAYGEGKLHFPLFGEEGVDEFDKIDLRTSQNYSWSKGGGNSKYNTMNRDVFSRDTQGDMNQPYTRSRYYHLYLNGVYWGVFQSQERADANFAESYFGGDKEDYDVVKVDVGENWDLYDIEATDGNTAAWQEIWNMTRTGFAANENYFRLQGLNSDGEVDTSMNVWVDIDNLIDYMLIIFYGGNFDSPVSKFSGNYNPNNFFAIYNRNNKRQGFKFLIHDAEHSLLTDPVSPGIGLYENRVNIGNISNQQMNVYQFSKFQPQWLHHKLTANAEYRMRFADRAYKHFFNTGVFVPDSCKSRFKSTANQLDMAIIAESARWGDMGSWPARNKYDDWLPAVNQVINDYIPYRSNIVLNQLRNENLYTDIIPPAFKKNGSEIIVPALTIAEDYDFIIENKNTTGLILYTLDGNDPRETGGAISGYANVAGNGKTIIVSPGTLVKARIKNGPDWSALHQILFTDAKLFTHLKVTELFYNPPDVQLYEGKDIEFIELKNTGNTALDLSGLTFTDGIRFTFPSGTIIPPQSFIIIASNANAYADYFGVSPDFEYSGNLANEGERIALETAFHETVFSFTYSDIPPWPYQADGEGYSLVSATSNPVGDPNNAAYWALSYNKFGSALADDAGSSITNNSDPLVTEGVDFNLFPNPATSIIKVSFNLSADEHVWLGLYDLNGRVIQLLINEKMFSGAHHKLIDLEKFTLESGMYLLKFNSENYAETLKLMFY